MYSINFRLRYDACIKHRYRTVNVRLKINGKCSDFGTSVKVPFESWVQSTQTIKGYAVEFASMRSVLSQTKADLINLILLNPNLSAKEIKNLYCSPAVEKVKPPKPVVWLCEVYQKYITEKKECFEGTDLQLKINTLQRWYNCKLHLFEFLNNQDIDIESVDNDFADRFYLYLIKKEYRKIKGKRIGHDYAVRNLTYLNQVLEFGKKRGFVISNVLEISEYKRNAPKEIECLTWSQVQTLEGMSFKGILQDVKDIFMAMVYSGINHCDLYNLESLKDTDVISFKMDRRKNEKRTMDKGIVPIFPELRKLLEKYNYKLPLHPINVINRHLHIFESILDVDIKITTYTARKTAAMLLSERGVSTEVVSRILGHTSIVTTQRYYVKVSQKRVERELHGFKFNPS